MGWWKRRRSDEFMRCANAYHDHMEDMIMLPTGHSFPARMLQDLPAKIEGRGGLRREPIIDWLESEIPGIGSAFYEWFEPESKGELIGEMLSSWTGAPLDEAKESEKDS